MVHIESSGHYQADRRYDMAMLFIERGDLGAAVELLGQVRELTATWRPAIFKHGEILMMLERHEEAIIAFKEYLQHDPSDALGARIKLALMGEDPHGEAISESYIIALFNDYAVRFENHLTRALRYDAPYELARVIDRLWPVPSKARIADLGCGTGLAGLAFKHRAAWLEGVDLSPHMLSEAKQKGIYDRLHAGNLISWLRDGTGSYDLIVAADVLIYLGDLTAFLEGVAARLAKEGLLAFSVQSTTESENFVLGSDHRYAHSDFFIQKSAAAQFTLLYGAPFVIRKEAGKDVEGMIYAFQKKL